MKTLNRKLQRKSDHDYSYPCAYFVTICTKNMNDYFGRLQAKELIFSEIGKFAYTNWLAIPKHFKDAQLDEFVIMPDHIHGIIHLLPSGVGTSPDNKFYVGNSFDVPKNLTSFDVGTNHGLSLQVDRMNERLPNIIKQYKSSVTRIVKNELNVNFPIWQRSYHDRIIRSQNELTYLRNYIALNPTKLWIFNENI